MTTSPEARKVCRDCGVEQALDAFPRQPGGRLGRHPLCKACRSAQERRRYARDRERILEGQRTDSRRRARVRWRALQRKYGLDRHEHHAIWVAQRGSCAICHVRADRLVVDHDHRTGRVRGLLCDRCNRALGHLRDSPGVCTRAAEYLRGSVPAPEGTGT
jgi:hypothetical protein